MLFKIILPNPAIYLMHHVSAINKNMHNFVLKKWSFNFYGYLSLLHHYIRQRLISLKMPPHGDFLFVFQYLV